MIFQLNLIAHHTDDNYDYQQLHCEVSKIVSESNERVIHWVIQSNFHMINNMFTIANIEPWFFFFQGTMVMMTMSWCLLKTI